MTNKRKKQIAKIEAKEIKKNSSYLDLIKKRINQNKLSFIIGLITIFIISSIGYIFFRQYVKEQQITLKSAKTQKVFSENQKEKRYRVKKDDNLWKIAENFYGSGYNAFDIAQTNKIKDPNLIYENQELIIPQIQSKKLTTGEIKNNKTVKTSPISQKYTIKKGDYLWKIALQYYGDGYAWVKIANFNKISNPNILYPGKVIYLP